MHAGRAFRKGDAVWVNIGWNTRGNQKFMKILPQELTGHVDPDAYNKFINALESNLDGKGGPCPMAVQICPVLACPVLPCYCYVLMKRKREFEDIIKQTISEHTANFAGGVSWNLTQTAARGDPEGAMGYNIVFPLRQLPANQAVVQAQSIVVEPMQIVRENGPEEKLRKLKELLDDGVLSHHEYEEKKKTLLAQL